MMRWLRAVLVLVVVVAAGAAACTADAPSASQTGPVSPFQPCPPQVEGARPAGGTAALPPIALPCFTGGAPVRLDRLGRPMVLNLWASWCGPCRAELPEFQRFAEAGRDKLVVLGVVTNDTRSAAAAAGSDLSITFPMVVDESAELQRSAGPPVLPVTLFVDAGGGIRHVDTSGALTLPVLTVLVREHLDLVVS